jgi:hypothetical protein
MAHNWTAGANTPSMALHSSSKYGPVYVHGRWQDHKSHQGSRVVVRDFQAGGQGEQGFFNI